MAKQRALNIVFPAGGVSKRYGFHKQAPYTTPSALNVWPTEWDTGRERGGVRPGVTSFGSVGTPYNWCEANWVGGTGIAVTHSGGTSVRTASSGWSTKISTGPGTDFASCAVYLQKVYQARGGGTARFVDITSSGSGTPLSNANGGTAPENCGIVVAWGDRVVFAGDTTTPNIVYMPRIGDPEDWDYSAVDAGGAWANFGAEGGIVGENITSLIPHNRDCLLVGGTDSIYAIRGNPKAGGQIYSLSNSVGPLMQSAWCKTGNDFTVMMTRDGLYSMRPGCGEPPISISRELLPEELTAIDPGSGDRVSVGYDARFRGIHIYVTRSGSRSQWFYDVQSKGFWEMELGFDVDLAPTLKSASSDTKSGLLAMSSGGTAYQFDKGSSESIDSHLYYGPIAIGSPHTEGVVSEITAVLSENSGSVAWEVYAADSPQEAFNLATPSFVGSPWDTQGLSYTQNPLVRGSAMYLKVESVSGSSWVIEEIMAIVRAAGRRRAV